MIFESGPEHLARINGIVGEAEIVEKPKRLSPQDARKAKEDLLIVAAEAGIDLDMSDTLAEMQAQYEKELDE